MDPSNSDQPARRGRPSGRSGKGEATRKRLFETALRLFGEQGYEETTLRQIATAAEVSPGLLYKYFRSKQDVVTTLHDILSSEYARRVADSPAGKWRDRFMFALRTSLEVLGPHRPALVALTPLLVSNQGDGIFSPERSGSRLEVEASFIRAVSEAKDSPGPERSESLGRILYVTHLGVLLWWLLDRSPGQQATADLLDFLASRESIIAMVMKLPFVYSMIGEADDLIKAGLLGMKSEE